MLDTTYRVDNVDYTEELEAFCNSLEYNNDDYDYSFVDEELEAFCSSLEFEDF